MGYVGFGTTNTATNNILLFMRGPGRQDNFACDFKRAAAYGFRNCGTVLRKALPEQVVPWLKGVLEQEGSAPRGTSPPQEKFSFGFEPGDMVSTVMSFGSPTPVEVVVIRPERTRSERTRSKSSRRSRRFPLFAMCSSISNSITRR